MLGLAVFGVSGGVKITGSVVEVDDIRDAASSPG